MTRWLGDEELRIGLGCMRIEPAAMGPTVATALAVGITVFDTAHAYGERPGDNERLLAQALRGTRARVVTKGGMTRAGTTWIPDGRAVTIRRHCEASLAALDGVGIDLYLLHAPDPKVPWLTSVRALARLLEDGLVPRVGLSNVNRGQLDAALSLLPVCAVQVALSPFDNDALRGGVVRRCEERGITVLAHSPLGGPRRVRRAEAQKSLTWVLSRSPAVVAIPGARSPEAVRSAVAALELEPPAEPAESPPAPSGAEVLLVMGIPGAGKSRLTAGLEGYERLNRDDRGGSLAALAQELDRRLAEGAERLVLDNTYLTRASRNLVVETSARHGARARCVWLDTPLDQAQVNLVLRQLALFGRLPEPQELRVLAKRHPGLMAPTSQLRAVRELEPPADDEGFAAVERVLFYRGPATGRPGVFVAADAVPGFRVQDPSVPHLVFGWQVPGEVTLPGAVVASCPHPGGPPACWCRPPLPGLVLAFCHDHGVDPARSVLVGTTSRHRTLAAALGARFAGLAIGATDLRRQSGRVVGDERGGGGVSGGEVAPGVLALAGGPGIRRAEVGDAIQRCQPAAAGRGRRRHDGPRRPVPVRGQGVVAREADHVRVCQPPRRRSGRSPRRRAGARPGGRRSASGPAARPATSGPRDALGRFCQVDACVTGRHQDLARDSGAISQHENAARRHQEPEYQEIPHARHAGIAGRDADGGHRQQRSREGEQEDCGPEPGPVAPAQYVLDAPQVIQFATARSPHNDATCPRLQRFDAAQHAS